MTAAEQKLAEPGMPRGIDPQDEKQIDELWKSCFGARLSTLTLAYEIGRIRGRMEIAERILARMA